MRVLPTSFSQSIAVFINPDFQYVQNNRIVTPLMETWNQRIVPFHPSSHPQDRGLKLLIDDLISVFSECPPLLHTYVLPSPLHCVERRVSFPIQILHIECTHYIPQENYKREKQIGQGACGTVYLGL